MAQLRLIEDARSHEDGFLVPVQLEHIQRSDLPIYLRALLDTRPCLQWPGEDLSESKLLGFWTGLKAGLGTPLAVLRRTVEGVERGGWSSGEGESDQESGKEGESDQESGEEGSDVSLLDFH